MTEKPPSNQEEACRQRLRQHMEGTRTAGRMVSRRIGVSASAVSQFLRGRYHGNGALLAGKIGAYLDNPPRATVLPLGPSRPDAIRFVETAAAREIFATARLARGSHDIAVIYGEPGAGKTVALEALRSEDPDHVIIITALPHHRTPAAMLLELARAFGLPSSGTNRPLLSVFDDIRRAVQDWNGLIIVDEAQHLTLESFEELRGLQDATGVPLILCGNETVPEQIHGRGKKAFAQLYSRVAIARRIPAAFAPDEVRRIFSDGDDLSDEAVTFLIEAARRGGAFRTIAKCLRIARLVRSSEGAGPLTVEELRTAYALLLQGSGN